MQPDETTPSPQEPLPEEVLPEERAPTKLEIIHEKRRKRLALTLWITAGLLLIMAGLGGWNVYAATGKSWKKELVVEPSGGGYFKWVKYYNKKGLDYAIPTASVLVIFSAAYAYLGFPVRKGNRTAALIAGILATLHALASSIWIVTLLMLGAVLSSDADTWWEEWLPIAMVAIWMVSVGWFLYVAVQAFEGGRRRGRRDLHAFLPVMVQPAMPPPAPPSELEQMMEESPTSSAQQTEIEPLVEIEPVAPPPAAAADAAPAERSIEELMEDDEPEKK
jgi:hypothetical protein